MASMDEEYERLGFLRKQGRGKEKVHVVFVEEEAKARVENLGEKPKTRFQWETDFPDGYSELNKGKDRLMRIIGNKQVAITIAAMLWNETPEDALRRLAEQEQPFRETVGDA
jgi:hypothetical protein